MEGLLFGPPGTSLVVLRLRYGVPMSSQLFDLNFLGTAIKARRHERDRQC